MMVTYPGDGSGGLPRCLRRLDLAMGMREPWPHGRSWSRRSCAKAMAKSNPNKNAPCSTSAWP